MKLFDFVTTLRDKSVSWDNAVWEVNISDFMIDDFRKFPTGNALRKWYYRQLNTPKTLQDIVDSMEDIKEKLSEYSTNPIGYDTEETKPVNHFPNIVSLPKLFHASLTIPLQQTLVIADIHAGYPDIEYLNGVIEHTLDEVYQLDAIVIAGDLFDFDGISRHPKDHNTARIEGELEVAAQILLKLSDIAPVYICSGNHDERLAVKLDTTFGLKRIISAALNGRSGKYTITATDYDYIDIGELFRVGHLSSYSRIPGKVAYGIAQSIKRTVLAGHDHLTGVFASQHDRYVGASIGCIADHNKFWYANRRMSDMPVFQKGYAIIDSTGSFSLFDAEYNQYFTRMYFGEAWYNCFASK